MCVYNASKVFVKGTMYGKEYGALSVTKLHEMCWTFWCRWHSGVIALVSNTQLWKLWKYMTLHIYVCQHGQCYGRVVSDLFVASCGSRDAASYEKMDYLITSNFSDTLQKFFRTIITTDLQYHFKSCSIYTDSRAR